MGAETKFLFRAWSNILPTKPPEALIEGILLRGRLGVIFAKPDNGKTFVALGMSLSVGTGEPFADRPVLKGASIYIAAEGAYDLEERVPAWRKLNPDAWEPEGGCYGEVVNFYDYTEVSNFIEQVKDRPLELLVIDTLAAVMVGGDEDRARDMNFLINNVKRVMKATGCAALIVHHAGWDTNREKGSIALRAAADVVIETTLEDEKPDGSRIVTLTCRKMKSMRKFGAFSITLVSVDVDSPGGVFKCLAIASGAGAAAKPAKKPSKKDDDLAAMEFVLGTVLGNKASSRDWMRAMQNYGKGYSEPNFDKKLGLLKEAKRVTGGGVQGEYYSVSNTAEARAARGLQPDPMGVKSSVENNDPRQTTLNPSPLKGGEGSEGSFGCPQGPSNSPQKENEGSSLESRKEENPVVSEPAKGGEELAAEALKHLTVKAG